MTADATSVLLCCDPAYAQHLGVLLVSLLENNPERAFDFVVVSRAPFGPAEAKLRRSLRRYSGATLDLRVFTPSAGPRLPTRAHCSVDIYTRLWVADFFPASVERVLYLDCDMVVLGPLDDLLHADLAARTLGAVSIPGSTRCARIGVPREYGYFNSGVLLIDLARWRKIGAFDRLMAYIAAHGSELIDPDQDALNACLYGERQPLSHIWNVITPFYFEYHPLGMSPAELARIREQARIVHFNGPLKPWSYFSNHPRTADYWRYLALTEWADFVPADRTVVNRLRRRVTRLVPPALRRALHQATSLAR